VPRLSPDDLARFRADYHECAETVMPLVLECEALTAERDRLAAAVRDALARLEPAGETCLCRDGSQLDVAMVRAGLRHALDTLAAGEGA
jgi:hypothetical protein